MRKGQLAAFNRYIVENQSRAALCAPSAPLSPSGAVLVSPEGFSPRWHPPRQKEPFCARGRMLYLSLYEATTREPTNAELYARCHEMVDLALNLPNLPTLPISTAK